MFIINIKGNIESLRATTLKEIEELYDLDTSSGDFIPAELSDRMALLTEKINREIAVYLDRKGKVLEVSVGDSKTAPLGEVEGRKNRLKLSGVRCVHTHPKGSGMLSSVDVSSLISLRLDAMAAIGVMDGKPVDIYAGMLARGEDGELDKVQVYGPFDAGDKRMKGLFDIIFEIDRTSQILLHSNEDEEEKAILVGLENGGKVLNGKSEGERLLDELEELAFTAGAKVLDKVLQKKQVMDTAYYVGKGKLEELALKRQALNANLLIFDDELSGAQVRNIEEQVGAKVIDRTTLILDIFAKRARSREGKIQVELAQLKYRLPRLIGLGQQLSRLGGGIGTRGPGEKKLEVDRRHIRRRVSQLQEELEDVTRRRGLMRENRKDIPTVALVGYTNAGKSTLMNTLCGADVFAENKLFATLDPTTRNLPLPEDRQALLVDTVGFIRKLPHELIEAFKSSLEEAVYADLLLHVVDVSSGEAEVHISVVEELLAGLGALNKPVILVLNKVDAAGHQDRIPAVNQYGPVCEISAKTGYGVENLRNIIYGILPKQEVKLQLMVPYSQGWVIPYLHQNGKIISEEYVSEGTRVTAEVKMDKASRLEEYTVK